MTLEESRQARSSRAAALSVEPTISVKRTVARTRSGSPSAQPLASHHLLKEPLDLVGYQHR
jgi:hypothetical protein